MESYDDFPSTIQATTLTRPEFVALRSNNDQQQDAPASDILDKNSEPRMHTGAEIDDDNTAEKTRWEWQDSANCLGVDPDLFFPERGASTTEAKEVCRGCDVSEHCLEFALANGVKSGIWGGMSERERRRIRRVRAVAKRAVESAGD